MSDDEMGMQLSGGPQQVEFWCLEVPPGKKVYSNLSEIIGVMEIAHVTSAALDENAKPGRHVVKIIPVDLDGTEKKEVALGTLELGRTDQFPADFGFSSKMGFRHTGKSSVFLSGYMTRSFDVGESDDDEYDDEMESGSEQESESEEEEEEAPQLVPMQQNGGKAVPLRGSGKAAAAAAAANGIAGGSSSEEDESEEEGESEDESEGEEGEDADMMGDQYDRRLGAKSFSDQGMSSDEGESESEDEGESESGDPLDIDSDDLVAGVEYADVEADEDDEGESSDEGESDDDEDDDEEEDESSDEEQPQQQAAAAAAKGKRGGQPLTPQPQQQAKKQKGQEGKPVPASAPAKGPAAKTAAAGGDAAVVSAYKSALVAELKKGGSQPLSTLATKVKRPEGLPTKFKAFLLQHPDTFTLNGEQVALKKQ